MRFLLVTIATAALFVLSATTAGAAPSIGTSAGSVDLEQLSDGSRAIPLKGEPPSWFTPDLAEQVDTANGVPVAAPTDAPLPSEVGIRPGAWMISPAGCTMNFIFGAPGSYAIGTAGHCAENGDEVVLLTVAPGGGNPVLVEVGSVLKSVDGGIGNDFALVSIRPELQSWVSPTTAAIGGPCGGFYGSGPQVVTHYGHGLAIGTGGTPRAGVALTWRADAFGWDGAAIFGDSGSPVEIATFPAAGDLTHLVVDRKWLPSYIAGTRIGRMLQIAGKALASSPLCAGASGGGGDTGGGGGRKKPRS